jgi:hypothetical protein
MRFTLLAIEAVLVGVLLPLLGIHAPSVEFLLILLLNAIIFSLLLDAAGVE